MSDALLETWNTHNRINLYLLDAIDESSLPLSITPKFRSIGKLFAHMHNVRLMWLKAAAPDLLEGLRKIDEEAMSKETLSASLTDSANAIAALVERSIANGGKVKNFKPNATAFIAYLISHESHHRGQVGWTLKFCGKPLDTKVAFGLWEWGTR